MTENINTLHVPQCREEDSLEEGFSSGAYIEERLSNENASEITKDNLPQEYLTSQQVAKLFMTLSESSKIEVLGVLINSLSSDAKKVFSTIFYSMMVKGLITPNYRYIKMHVTALIESLDNLDSRNQITEDLFREKVLLLSKDFRRRIIDECNRIEEHEDQLRVEE